MNQEEKKHYLISILYVFIVFAFFSIYLYLRRGYYNLYIINKVFGSTAAVVAGLTLVISPLAKRFKSFSQLLTVRKQLGLCAFGIALLHVSVSLLQQKRFPFPSWYLKELIPVFFGISAIIIWTYMTYISRNKKIKELGVEVWKKHLSIAGQIAFLSIFAHLTIMKYQGWLNWLNGKVKVSPELANPLFPPASTFVFLIMATIIVIRLFHYFFHKRDNHTPSN